MKKAREQSGSKLLVLDPNLDPKWEADYITDDQEKFKEIVKANQDCQLAIDESGETIGRYAKDMTFIATRSRHYGHYATFVAQRIQQIDRNVRDQCIRHFIFSIAKSDAKILAEDLVDDAILEAYFLKQGECIVKEKFKEAYTINIFDM